VKTRIRWLASLITSVLLASAAVTGEEKLLDSPYFPHKEGTEWTYAVGDKKVVLRVAKFETVNKIPCVVLETQREGLAITEHVTIKRDGVFRVKALRFEVEPPLCILKWPVTAKTEKSWKGVAQIGGESFSAEFSQEEGRVTVPIGEFPALIVRCEVKRAKSDNLVITTYYGRGRGMVKQVQKLGDKEIVMVLEKMEESK
jgi:hypothetical protein